MKRIIFILAFIAFLPIACTNSEKGIPEKDAGGTTTEEQSYLDPKVNEFVKVEKNDDGTILVNNLFTNPKDNKGNLVYVKFNLEQAKVVTGDDWDIAFFNRAIIVNGGEWTQGYISYTAHEPERTKEASVAVIDGDFNIINSVPNNVVFKQDGKDKTAIDDRGKGMFDPYGMHNDHVIRTKKGKLLLIKTINGNYAKLKIEDIYKDGDHTGDMNEVLASKYPYYTFKYFYNTTKGNKTLN
ncbi:heme binding lipoprotein precursor HmuY-family [Tenacibaculum maritimum]|uniref:HmuY family protein n=1 Tax=Tenacibaculum maritimum TaxID=107401 RepID=UPI0012E65872|nr:HmuY family protein [Tenacibaculum maritimum]CAA0253176.1 heme binding lipoprotein precursor HmuY-family [Tenacibaculum maritimum]CAA0261519.1 heme binding lipoprotein precursor HmuY-family [Tenacibaculum maritimum]